MCLRALCAPFSPKVLWAGVAKGLIVRSDLEPGEYSSLTRIQASGVKCVCPVCTSDTDHSPDPDNRLAIQGSKIDTLMRIGSTLQTQNHTILKLLDRFDDRLEEEKAGE